MQLHSSDVGIGCSRDDIGGGRIFNFELILLCREDNSGEIERKYLQCMQLRIVIGYKSSLDT